VEREERVVKKERKEKNNHAGVDGSLHPESTLLPQLGEVIVLTSMNE
jgi:hypothetical protein